MRSDKQIHKLAVAILLIISFWLYAFWPPGCGVAQADQKGRAKRAGPRYLRDFAEHSQQFLWRLVRVIIETSLRQQSGVQQAC